MSRKILVADDSVVIQKSIGITFAQEDFQVTFVGNGEEAFQRAFELKPDLILADTSMPKISGADLCKKFRQESEFKRTPILLLANSQESFSEGQLKSFGANDFIQKPFESNLLLEKVKALFSTQSVAATSKPSMEQSLEDTFASQTVLPDADTAVAFQAPQPEFGTSLEMEKSEDFMPDSLSLKVPVPEPSANTLASLDVLSIDDDDEDEDEIPVESPSPNFAAFEEEPTKTVKAGDVFMATSSSADIKPAPTLPAQPASQNAPDSLQLSEQQIEQIVSKVFQNVIERIAWEVVPDLAERIIKEELQKITSDA